MKIDRKALGLAIRNAGILSALLFIVLCIFENKISFRTTGIYFGYAIICFTIELPLFYISIQKHWLSYSPSAKSLYLPVLSFIFLLPLSMLYTSIIYGYPPLDYFISPAGGLNAARLAYHIKLTLTGVAFVFANQIMGAATEKEIIVNSSRMAKGNDVKLNISGLTFKVEDLLYVESEANYLRIVCRNDEMRIRQTMKQFLTEAKEFSELAQCHRAYTINLHNVSYYECTSRKGEVHFQGRNDTIPVSRSYAQNITDALNTYRQI